jgi:hypothetical protein
LRNIQNLNEPGFPGGIVPLSNRVKGGELQDYCDLILKTLMGVLNLILPEIEKGLTSSRIWNFVSHQGNQVSIRFLGGRN